MPRLSNQLTLCGLIGRMHAGILVACKGGGAQLILCPANLLVPFLPSTQRENLVSASHASLLPETRYKEKRPMLVYLYLYLKHLFMLKNMMK